MAILDTLKEQRNAIDKNRRLECVSKSLDEGPKSWKELMEMYGIEHPEILRRILYELKAVNYIVEGERKWTKFHYFLENVLKDVLKECIYLSPKEIDFEDFWKEIIKKFKPKIYKKDEEDSLKKCDINIDDIEIEEFKKELKKVEKLINEELEEKWKKYPSDFGIRGVIIGIREKNLPKELKELIGKKRYVLFIFPIK